MKMDLTPYKKAAGNLEAEQSKHAEMLDGIRALEISSPEDREFAGGLLREVKAQHKEYEQRRKDVVQPLNQVVRTINGWFKPITSTFKEAEQLLKTKLAAAVGKMAEEQRALQLTAAEASTPKEASEILAQLREAPKAELPAGMHSTFTWKFEVEDLEEVPREFLAVDSVRVAVYIKACKERGIDPLIPGIRFYQKETVTVR